VGRTGAAPGGAPQEGEALMAKRDRELTDAERDERRAHDRQRLKDACEQLLSSEGWQRWARARARNGLARHSVSNLCLILQANPDASFVAGFKAWLDLGYCVRKGEHAIWIFAPIPTRRRGSDPADDTDEQEPRVRFRAVPVFDTLSRDRRQRAQPCRSNPLSRRIRRLRRDRRRG
jgi:N-terminal domain of anti-restriction factor ArdC